MRIAQIAPLYESVPPQLYGGTERVVSYLTEELMREGHDVTLFASADSKTSARLVPACERALRLKDGPASCPLAPHVLELECVVQQAHEFDVIHSHADFLLFPAIRHMNMPAVTTLHGRLDSPDIFPLFREFQDMRLVSISDAQRAPMSWANWTRTVHHGLPEENYRKGNGRGGYLAFLGRVSPEKGLIRAIQIAKLTRLPLRVAAKVDPCDQEYFDRYLRPKFKDPQIEFIGEIGEAQKSDFLGDAFAMLFPIDWPEPFGLVIIEAMACGTPVIAFPCGSVLEILDDGITGFIVRNPEAAARAVDRIPTISRSRCREVFETRFSARRMCQDYLQIYEKVAQETLKAA